MHAPRHRLRFITGLSLTAAFYGTGQYGSSTYGQKASDPTSSLNFTLVPWPGGHLPTPAWLYRQGDTMPRFEAHIRGDDGVFDLDGVAYAHLVLTNTDGATDMTPWVYVLTIENNDGQDWLVRDWLPTDLAIPGAFRAAAVLVYTSGRRLTVPADDNTLFVINANSTIPVPDFPDYHWSDARWNYAYWS